jgi:hypothetical protein
MNFANIRIQFSEISLMCATTLLILKLHVVGYILLGISVVSALGRFVIEFQQREEERKRKKEEMDNLKKIISEASRPTPIVSDMITH